MRTSKSALKKSRLVLAASLLLMGGTVLLACHRDESGYDDEGPGYSDASECLAVNASVIGLSDTQMDISGNGNVQGSVVLLGDSRLSMVGNAKVQGGVFVGDRDRILKDETSFIGIIIEHDLTIFEPLLLTFGEKLRQFRPTVVLDRIRSSTVLRGNGFLNVIQVNGDVALASDEVLTIQGSEHDLFVIRVAGNAAFSGNASVSLQGGVSARNILFVLTGDGATLQITGSGRIIGSWFAARGNALISGNGRTEGAIFASGTIQIVGNGLAIEAAPFCPGRFTPSPRPSEDDDDESCEEEDDDDGEDDGEEHCGEPTVEPTVQPSVEPSPAPSPTVEPSVQPTVEPTVEPTPAPSPTVEPTVQPSVEPSPAPSPTVEPAPSPEPSPVPTYTAPPCTGISCGGGILGV